MGNNTAFAAIFLMIVSVFVMLGIAFFIIRVNRNVQRQHRERYFGDISHIRIPDDPSELTDRKKKPKPPYRPW